MIQLPHLLILAALASWSENPPPAAHQENPSACDAAVAEIVEGETRVRELQARMQTTAQASEQNARNQQSVARGSTALGWATGLASLVPGVGFAASAAAGAASQQAIMAGQRATAATNQTMADVVAELVTLNQRMQSLRQAAAARGCALPAPPPQ